MSEIAGVCVCEKKRGTLLLKSWDSLAWARDVVDGTPAVPAAAGGAAAIKQRRRIRVRACEPASAPADKRRRSNACAGSGRRRAAGSQESAAPQCAHARSDIDGDIASRIVTIEAEHIQRVSGNLRWPA